MSLLGDLLNALPAVKANPVSLLDALPDPKAITQTIDYESKPSLLESNPVSMSAAERFAVMLHSKEGADNDGAKNANKKRKAKGAPVLSKKKREKKIRGKEIKARTRGNQR